MNLVAADFEQNILVPEESHSALRQADTGDWPERTGRRLSGVGGGGGGGVTGVRGHRRLPHACFLGISKT
jgi:hypothetical protein